MGDPFRSGLDGRLLAEEKLMMLTFLSVETSTFISFPDYS
jgi:hypothetical protein